MVKTRRMPRIFKWAAKPCLALAATVLALVVGEVLWRAFGLAPPVRAIWLSSPDSTYKRSTNPLLGYELKADYRHDNDIMKAGVYYERVSLRSSKAVSICRRGLLLVQPA